MPDPNTTSRQIAEFFGREPKVDLALANFTDLAEVALAAREWAQWNDLSDMDKSENSNAVLASRARLDSALARVGL